MGGRTSKGEDRPGPPPKPEIGFDDFELLRAIGRGSFGKVRRDVSRNSSGKKGAKFKFGNLFLQVMAKKSLAGLFVFVIDVDFDSAKTSWNGGLGPIY